MLADPACTGFFTLALAHETGATSSSVEYLATRLPWREPLHLLAEWGPRGIALTVNGVETRTLPLAGSPRNLRVGVVTGGMRVENLVYSKMVR
jgi:hypothetical protein